MNAEEILNEYITEKAIVKIILNYKKQLEKNKKKKKRKKFKKNNNKKKRKERKLLRFHKINMTIMMVN
tara:strand:- start:820 stop:1023 length:204 start_codon:yes stop_codon:yes gene_type:complete